MKKSVIFAFTTISIFLLTSCSHASPITMSSGIKKAMSNEELMALKLQTEYELDKQNMQNAVTGIIQQNEYPQEAMLTFFFQDRKKEVVQSAESGIFELPVHSDSHHDAVVDAYLDLSSSLQFRDARMDDKYSPCTKQIENELPYFTYAEALKAIDTLFRKIEIEDMIPIKKETYTDGNNLGYYMIEYTLVYDGTPFKRDNQSTDREVILGGYIKISKDGIIEMNGEFNVQIIPTKDQNLIIKEDDIKNIFKALLGTKIEKSMKLKQIKLEYQTELINQTECIFYPIWRCICENFKGEEAIICFNAMTGSLLTLE